MLLKINGKNIEIKIEKRNRKTVKISVENPEKLRVFAPSWVGDTQLEEILNSKKEWISQALSKSVEIMNEESLKYTEGKKVLFKGKEYLLTISEDEFVLNAKIVMENESIKVLFNPNTPLNIRNNILVDCFRKWYVQEAKNLFNSRIEYFSQITGLKPEKISYKFQKTRWGSCSGKGNINLNVNLILAPVEIADYVILHEICHLKYLDHSRKFWDFLGKYMVDYKNRREWLKKNGYTLKI